VLEKTPESPLVYKDIQPVHPKANQSWTFIGRTDVEAETPILWATWCEELTHLKRPWCWERLKVGGEGDDRAWDGWMASPTQWTWVSDGQGGLACCGSWGCKESDMTELNITWDHLKILLAEVGKRVILISVFASNGKVFACSVAKLLSHSLQLYGQIGRASCRERV